VRGRTGYDADDAGEPAAPWPPDRERLWEILQAVPAGITVLGSDGALLFANVAAARLAGFSTAASMVAAGAEEARARLEIRDEAGEPVPADRLPCHLALTGQQPAPLAIRLHDHRTGERRRARLSAASIPDESSGGWHAITAINEVGAARRGAGEPVRTGSPDLDEERAAAEVNRAAELSAIIGAMGEGIVVFAASGTAVLANPAAEDLFPGIATWTYAELLGRLEDGPAEGPPLGAVGGPVELRTSERTERWIEVSADPIAPGGAAPGETIIVLRDVTATRQREAVRDMFVGMLSHELRTPVTTIYAGAKVLARHRDALTGPWLEIFDWASLEFAVVSRLQRESFFAA
jgi:PAS domain-containing protein